MFEFYYADCRCSMIRIDRCMSLQLFRVLEWYLCIYFHLLHGTRLGTRSAGMILLQYRQQYDSGRCLYKGTYSNSIGTYIHMCVYVVYLLTKISQMSL